ncbi:MAG: 2-amino-4-hydroxy-6-hydroxymethyldihydropteridine diphosphokinase [Phycisphaerae bacterium]|nr:2-amino-4-hydroxy-6-hydroxymethyldihydropteridine diphosphokinase [Phycisphaerae bacterium]
MVDHDSTAFIALGSNLGNRLAALRGAVKAIDDLHATAIDGPGAIAGLYETFPVDVPDDQPVFLNSAVRVATRLEPRALLEHLLDIEQAWGRQRRQPNAPRPLDLDLLLFDDRVIDEVDLRVPHPRLHLRRFVLEPLTDIASEVVHPVLGQTITELLTDCRSQQQPQSVTRIAEADWFYGARSFPRPEFIQAC